MRSRRQTKCRFRKAGLESGEPTSGLRLNLIWHAPPFCRHPVTTHWLDPTRNRVNSLHE